MTKKQFSRQEIAQKAHLNVPDQCKQKYIDILFRHQAAISVNKMDLGRAKILTHKIHLKDNKPCVSQAVQNSRSPPELY